MRARKRTELPAALKSIDVRAVMRRQGVYLKLNENKRLKKAALPLATALVKKNHLTATKPKSDPEPQKYSSFDNVTARKYWEKQIHNVETLEKHFDEAIRKFLVNHVLRMAEANLQAIIDTHKGATWQTKTLQKLIAEKQLFNSQDEEDLINQAQINFEPLLQNMAVIAGQDANKLIGTDDPYIPSDKLRARILKNVKKFTQSMINTDQEYLADVITDGIEAGMSVPEIGKRITDDFTEYSKMQSTRITRTEVLRSANQSTIDAFKQSGVVEGKQWLTAGAVDECEQYDGEIETLDSNFYVETDEFKDGDPPLHPNCRCVLIPVLSS